MSNRLSLKEALEQRGSAGEKPRNPAGLPVVLILRMNRETGMARPVDVVRLLTSQGLGMRRSHDALNRLARGETVTVELPAVEDPERLDVELAALGVRGLRRVDPAPVDITALRKRMGLTQREFSARFGFELGSLRNWEQNRSPQDLQTRLLLHVIAWHPEVVDEVVEKMDAVSL